MSSMQVSILKRDWPHTLESLALTYCRGIEKAVTDASGHNLAGHVLFYLERAHVHAVECHGAELGARVNADRLFAAEVEYLARRNFQPRSVVPVLGTCWYNLVHERGERWRRGSSPTSTRSAARFPRQCDNVATVGAVLAEIGAARA